MLATTGLVTGDADNVESFEGLVGLASGFPSTLLGDCWEGVGWVKISGNAKALRKGRIPKALMNEHFGSICLMEQKTNHTIVLACRPL